MKMRRCGFLRGGKVVERLQTAETNKVNNTTPIWIMFLSKALPRKPTQGKQGRADKGQLSKQFHAIQRGDWGFLLERLGGRCAEAGDKEGVSKEK